MGESQVGEQAIPILHSVKPSPIYKHDQVRGTERESALLLHLRQRRLRSLYLRSMPGSVWAEFILPADWSPARRAAVYPCVFGHSVAPKGCQPADGRKGRIHLGRPREDRLARPSLAEPRGFASPLAIAFPPAWPAIPDALRVPFTWAAPLPKAPSLTPWAFLEASTGIPLLDHRSPA